MRIEAGKEEIIKYSYICDVCGKGSDHHRVCSICGRDICFNCTKFDPRDIGDYPSIYCDHCFQIGQKYLDRISTEEEKCDAMIEGLEQEWRYEAMEVVKKDKERRGT
jgi:hypothetical protein